MSGTVRAHALRVALAAALTLIATSLPALAAPVPFTIVDERPFVEVSLNGATLHFLVDTGAGGHNAVARRAAERLHLQSRAAGSVGGANAGQLDVSAAVVDRFSFGSVTLRHASFTVADFTPLERRIGFQLDGIVGSETLTAHCVRFDFPHRTIEIDPAGELQGTTVPIRLSGGWPIVEAAVDGVRGEFLVDTGDRSYLTLFTPFALAHYPRERRPLRDIVTGFGLVAPIVTDLTRTRFALGGLDLPDLVTRLATQTAGGFASDSLAGSIGSATFHDAVLEIDYVRRRLTIAQPAPARRSEWDHAGMWLSHDGGALVVDAVVPGGPAASAGLHAGDRLIAVNGEPAGTIDLPALRAGLASASATDLRVTVRRDGRDTVLLVHPRALI